MSKSPEAFRTISEVAEVLDVPPHVLRFWETRFTQVKPVKRGGGRRYYRPEDVRLLRGIRGLLYDDGMTIKGVQKILRERGLRYVIGLGTEPGTEGGFETAAELEAATREMADLAAREAEAGDPDADDAEARAFAEAEAVFAVRDALEAAGTEDDCLDNDISDALEADPEDGKAHSLAEDFDRSESVVETLFGNGRGVEPADGVLGAAPRQDRAALVELVAKLEALRAVMVRDIGR